MSSLATAVPCIQLIDIILFNQIYVGINRNLWFQYQTEEMKVCPRRRYMQLNLLNLKEKLEQEPALPIFSFSELRILFWNTAHRLVHSKSLHNSKSDNMIALVGDVQTTVSKAN